MGWLKIGARAAQIHAQIKDDTNAKYTTEHVEDVQADYTARDRYKRVDVSVPDAQLPFVAASEVVAHISRDTGGLWIVVNNIIYDCTDFITEHPGGEQVIKSFAGAECSWQFWRFHGKKEMEQDGRPLRVARTEGMKNKYPEPKRYVGLRNGNDDW